MRVGLTVGDASSIVAHARHAEDLGFDYLAAGEHLFFHGPTPNAFALLAAAAGATEQIRLVSSIALLPLYPAALVAKLAATVDQISDGRFELGVGSGGEYLPEFEAAGVDPATRFRRVDEGLEMIKRLFTGERITLQGEFATLSGVALDPPPVQPGGPPVWLGGRKAGAMRRAGRYADVWMPYMVDPGRLRDSMDEVRRAAVEHGRPAAAVSGALFLWTFVDADGAWARRRGIETVSAAYNQDFGPLADRYLLLGTPAQAMRRLEEFAEAGADTLLVAVATDKQRERERAIRTLAEEVLPQLKAARPGGRAPGSEKPS